MTDHVYRVTEVYGSSSKSIDEAIGHAVRTASETVRHIEWFEVSEIRGRVQDSAVAYYQVGLKLGFRYDKD